jgi:hypothetical protein
MYMRTLLRSVSLSAIVLVLVVTNRPTSAGTLLYCDFEDGQIPFLDTLMPNSTPTNIAVDSDTNQFLRMTVGSSDCGPSYNTYCPKNRAELFMGVGPTDDQIVTYSFSMRIPSFNPADNHLLVQVFQGYRVTLDYGRTFWLGTSDGEVFVQNDVDKKQRLTLGSVQYDTWVNYKLVVYLTPEPDLGRIDVYKDAELMGSITGQATERTSEHTSDMFLNVVSFDGSPGTADFDNAQITSGTDADEVSEEDSSRRCSSLVPPQAAP